MAAGRRFSDSQGYDAGKFILIIHELVAGYPDGTKNLEIVPEAPQQDWYGFNFTVAFDNWADFHALSCGVTL
jgi:hypothetical protein